MTPITCQPRSRCHHSRAGAAAVECAIVSPMLMLLILGAIDLGQYANVYQKVSDASRAGARLAVRHDTATVSQVEAEVRNYLEDVCPDAAAEAMASAAEINVSGANGSPISGGNLSPIASGSLVSVRVTLQYDPVRWISGFEGLDGSVLEATTIMRRE